MQSLLQHAAQRVVLGSWCRGQMHGSLPLALVAELCHGHATSAGHMGPASPAASPPAACPVTSAISSYPAGHQNVLVMAACRSLATWRLAAPCAAPSSCSAALTPTAACQLASTSRYSGQSTFSAVAAGGVVPAASQPSAREPTANPGPAQPPPPPWTFTQHLRKRKTLPKRMGHMLQVLEDEQVKERMAATNIPDFGPGSVLEVKLAIPENRRRVAVTRGLCIARRNRGIRTSFTIRNHMGTAGGMERTFPLFSPHIQEIKVLTQRKVRRAKLYYLRDRPPRDYRTN